MDEGSLSPESQINGLRKRKRSPYSSDSESQTMNGDSTSEANHGLASGHTSPTDRRALSSEIAAKRSRLHDLSPASDLTVAQPVGRSKVPSMLLKLPPELWQHIFTFVPPLFLGRLLRVNRLLNALLDPSKALPPGRYQSHSSVSLQDQDHVWSVARKRFTPGMPRPMSSMSELGLWRLLLSSSCHFCAKKATSDPPSSSSPWNAGPGTEGVRIVWPFAVRSCGSCLQTHLIKVICGRGSDNWGLADPAPGNGAFVLSILCPDAWFAICLLHSIAKFRRLSYSTEHNSSSNRAIDQMLLSASN